MERKMKVAIYNGIGNVSMEEREIPIIANEDVLVKILRAGICGSDTGAYVHGGEPTGIFPGRPFGHEMVGKIVEVGRDVKDIQLGDIVFVEPLHACKAGTIMCDMIGAFSEYVKVENAKVNYNIFQLDKNIDLDTAAIIEPVCVGTKAATCMEPKLDDKVVVLGAGTIGLSAAAALVSRGMKNVTVVDKVAWRLAKAKEIGAMTIDTSKDNMIDKLVEYYGQAVNNGSNMKFVDPILLNQFIEYCKSVGMNLAGKIPDVDLVVDAAGAFPLLDECFSNSKHGCKFSIAAVYGRKLELSGGTFIKNEPIIRGSQAYDADVIKEVIESVLKKTPIKTIITKKFKHEDFPQAIKEASDTSKNIKVIIDYEM